MPLKAPLSMRAILRSTSRHQIVWYFVLGIVIPGLFMGILAFRGIRNDQALAEREQRRFALQDAATIMDSTEALLEQRQTAFAALIGVMADSGPGIDGSISGFVQRCPELMAVYRITPSGIILADGSLQFLPAYVRAIDASRDLLVADEPPSGWTYEYQQKAFDRAHDLYRALYESSDKPAVRAMACNALARLEKKRAGIQAAIEYYEVMRDSFADFRLAQSIPLGLTASVELSILHLLERDTVKGASALRDLLTDLASARWELEPTIYALFTQKAAATYQQLDAVRDNVPRRLMMEIDRVWFERQDRERLADCQLSVFRYLSEHRHDLIRTTLIGPQSRQSYEAEGLQCVLSLVPSAPDTTWALLTLASVLVESAIQPWMAAASSNGRWAWSVRDERQPAAVAQAVNFQEHDLVEVQFPAYLPHLTLVGVASPVTFVGSMLQSGRGSYLYIFLFTGAMLITGLLFVTYSINRETQLNKMKAEFVATVSHEFKSPLTAIRQMTEMLQRGRVPEEKRDMYYSVMMQQGARLAHLIDNVLDFSRIEQGKKTYLFKTMGIAHIIQRSVDAFRQRHADTGFMITLETAPEIPAMPLDETAIRQVIDNLLDNAAKYSGEARRIEVEVAEHGQMVRVSVRDFGMGIPQHDHERVFDRFYRVESEEHRRVKGSGLGLNLVRRIVEAHGGSTYIESAPGEGTTISFELPVQTIQIH